MIWFIVILLLIMFSSVSAAKHDQFHYDYLDKDNTNIIKGIFVFLIILSHAAQYLTLDGVFDQPYDALRNHLNQMVVVMFFFYSGYGMLESVKKKGFDYVKRVPMHRLLPVFINMALAVILFLILEFILGTVYPLKHILLAFTGYTTVGNSNWYMFNIMVAYVLFFVAFLVLRINPEKKAFRYLGMAILTLLIIGFVYSQIMLDRPRYSYNTVIFLAAGGWYSLLKEPIEKFLFRSDFIWLFITAVSVVLYALTFQYRFKGVVYYTFWGACFCAITLLLTMKIQFHSRLLLYMGKHIFPIYILQRIPMIIMDTLGISTDHKYYFVLLAIIFALLMVKPFEMLSDLVQKKLLRLQ